MTNRAQVCLNLCIIILGLERNPANDLIIAATNKATWTMDSKDNLRLSPSVGRKNNSSFKARDPGKMFRHRLTSEISENHADVRLGAAKRTAESIFRQQ